MKNTSQRFRIDTVQTNVEFPVIEDFHQVPSGSDVIIFIGFCDGDLITGDISPIVNLSETLNNINAYDENGRVVSQLAKDIICAWNAGAKYIVVIKAGTIAELEAFEDDDEDKYLFIYDRLQDCYGVATGLEWSGIILPNDVFLEGDRYHFTDLTIAHNDDVKSYDVPTTSDRLGNIRYALTPHVESISIGGTELAASGWYYDPENGAIVLNEYPTDDIKLTGFYSVDYAKQLGLACANSIEEGTFLQGIINSKYRKYKDIISSVPFLDRHSIQLYELAKRGRWIPRFDEYRFISASLGHGYFYLDEFKTAFENTLGSTIAGITVRLPYDISCAGRTVSNIRLTELFTKREAAKLSFLGVITFGETVRAKRASASEIVCLTDQNMGTQASDFQQNVTMRLMRRIVWSVKTGLEKIIGTDGSGIDTVMASSMSPFINNNYIKSYEYTSARDRFDPFKIQIKLSIDPYFTTKVINISIKAGPFSG